MSENGNLPTALHELDKDTLERMKLAEEIRKLGHEADTAQAEADRIWTETDTRVSLATQNCVYPFFEVVEEGSVSRCMLTLDSWHRRFPIEQPFTIIINSPGGSVIDGFALFDALEAMKADGRHIITVGRGFVASMAGILLQAGDERVLGPRATFLIHELSGSFQGKRSSMIDEQTLFDNLTKQGMAVLAERSTLTADEVAERCDRRDWYLTSEEAVELGFADRIG